MTKVLPHFITSRNIFPLIVFFLMCSAGYSVAETAATSEWDISADKITRFENPESIIAEGNIVLIKKEKIPPKPKKQEVLTAWSELLEEKVEVVEVTPQDLETDSKPQYQTKVRISADWVAYDVQKKIIKARGNVTVKSGDDMLFADQAEVNLEKETGTFTDARITRKENELHVEGSVIQKTGENTYRVEDGWVITCKLEEGEAPPWSLASSTTTIEPGGYAVLKHARFKIKDFPIFYVPYFIVPVKNTRQTGLLPPEFSNSSRDGFGFSIPLFINVSDSFDMTIYSDYYSKRGVMPGLELRYVFSESNKATFTGNYLDDDLSDPSETEYYLDTKFTHTNSERYWLRGKADHDFGNNFIARLDVDIVSDRDYLTEFKSGYTGFNDTQYSYLTTFGRGFETQSIDQRKNTLKFLKSWSGSSLNLEFLAINDVRTFETSPTPLWKLPSLDYSGAQAIGDTTLTFDWDAGYVNYWREDGIGAHRFDLFPKISAPVPVGKYFESRAEFGVRETFYNVTTHGDGEWTQDDSPDRLLYTFHTEIATMLERDYSIEDDEYTFISHSIRPYLGYDYIPDEDQSDQPYFDDVDYIGETNAITYGFDTFLNLWTKDSSGNDKQDRQYAYLKVRQGYDLRSDYSDDTTMPLKIKLGWRPMKKLNLAYKAEIPFRDFEDDEEIHGITGSFTSSRGDYFSLDYRYNKELGTEQINSYFKALLLPRILSELKLEHSLAEDETNEAVVALTYLADCWSVKVAYQYSLTEERVLLVFKLANIGSNLGVNF